MGVAALAAEGTVLGGRAVARVGIAAGQAVQHWGRGGEGAGLGALLHILANAGELGDIAGGHVDTVALALGQGHGASRSCDAASSSAIQKSWLVGLGAGAVLVSGVLRGHGHSA